MSVDKALRQTMRDQTKSKVVWENASQASDFGAQSISVNLTGWDDVLMTFGASDGTLTGYDVIPIDGILKRVYSNTIYASRRNITVSASRITFEDGYQDKGNGLIVENAAAKPLTIIARKIIGGGL